MNIDFSFSSSTQNFNADFSASSQNFSTEFGTVTQVGATDHAQLEHLDFDSSGHTGFTSSADFEAHKAGTNQHTLSGVTGLEARLQTIESKLLPDVTAEDNGKSLKVINSEWEVSTIYTLTGNDAGGNTLTL